jgi:shikimate dehydrogenase
MINPNTKVIFSVSSTPGQFGTIFHNYLYSKLSLDYIYKACPCSNIEHAVNSLRSLSLHGMSVSMPFKIEAKLLIDKVTPPTISSINTIINNDGTLTGYNTDQFALEEVTAGTADLKNVLIIGTGAISRLCIDFFFKNKNLKVNIVGRDQIKIELLKEEYELERNFEPDTKYDLLINATNQRIDDLVSILPKSSDKHFKYVYDYPISNTAPLTKIISIEQYVSGLQITKIQAQKQFELYTGRKLSGSDINTAFNFTVEQMQKK